MRRIILSTLASVLFLSTAAYGQQEPAEKPVVDKVGQEASALEAELGKYKDTSSEAADVLVKLVDLYHADGRVFGLIRAGQKFAASHPDDRRHQAVMLKLIDGLEAMSRNRDLAVACRQFLTRYPKSPQTANLTRRLAYTLEELNDRVQAAAAYKSLWEMQPNVKGRNDGFDAVRLFTSSDRKEDVLAGCELAEEMFDKLPPSPYTERIAWRAFTQYRRVSAWAEANALGRKMLAKNFPKDPEQKHQLHRYMAEGFSSQSQYVNAVESYQKARAIRKDDQNVHYYLIDRMHNAKMSGAKMQPVVNEYVKTYPDRFDRFSRLGYLGHAYLRDGDKPKARQIFFQTMQQDAEVHGVASQYLATFESEPADIAAAEKGFLAAIKTNERNKYYLQYLLGFSIYRDRLKDNNKAKAVLRRMLAESPTNSNYSKNAIVWLLSSATSDAEFAKELDHILKVRSANMHLTSFRSYLPGWATSQQATIDKKKAAGKELSPEEVTQQKQIKLVQAKVAAADKDPVAALWLQMPSKDGWRGDLAIRDKLLEPAVRAKLTHEQIIHLLEDQTYRYERYVSTAERPQSATLAGELVKLEPTHFGYARQYLVNATNYAPVEVRKEAALHILKLDPPRNEYDAWRRLFSVASQLKDKDLLQKAFDWLQKSQQKYGLEPYNATYIGDILVQFEMEAEAVAYWKSHYQLDRESSESRDCAARLAARMETVDEKIAFYNELFKHDTNLHGEYAVVLASLHLDKNDLNSAIKLLEQATARQAERPFASWGMNVYTLSSLFYEVKNHEEVADADKKRFYQVVADAQYDWPSAAAMLTLADLTPVDSIDAMDRLLLYQRPTILPPPDSTRWDQLMPYAQSAANRDDHLAAATLVTAMLTNFTSANASRQQAGRSMVARSYAKIGSVGLTIDESSPTAPLLRAALYLRLGDERMAFDAYLANKALFAKHENELPVDLVLFVCERLIAAGGADNHTNVEDILRNWLIKNSESKQVEDADKANVQLLLARNYFKAQRFDLSRSEFTTVINRYPGTPQAIEAEFGIGETFLAQKVYDQAEQVFQKLAANDGIDISVRAEFLLGVLAFRRGDHDDARDIFRSVLERSPRIDLANQTLFSLSEVFGAEERYLDQLNLLRTVGRLGRESKRVHRPGLPLSIVVNDSDLGISRGHSRIEVIVTTVPGGDQEAVFLTSGGASKGLFRVDLDTQLGDPKKGDGVLQLTGNDMVRCDYPDEFKKEFQRVPLSDVEIRIAADARFEISSSKIVDAEEESFADRLTREARDEEEADQRLSQGRPANQIKPGNLMYLRVQDPDRDLTEKEDTVTVKLGASSGDQVQTVLTEIGPHSGVFEGVIRTGELPAGAQATDNAIDHTPLMAIDHDPETYWMSEPDGATPKSLSIDLKDLKAVSRVSVTSPKADTNIPIRGRILGSQDGEFWFRLASHPKPPTAQPVVGEYGQMKRRVYAGDFSKYKVWQKVIDLTRDGDPTEEEQADELAWVIEEETEAAKLPHAAVWHGLLPQRKAGAARIRVNGTVTALVIDGIQEIPLGTGSRQTDVWLSKGLHEVTIFAATNQGSRGVSAEWVRADFDSSNVNLRPFQASDFDLAGFDLPAKPVAEGENGDAKPSPAGVIQLPVAEGKLAVRTENFAVDQGKKNTLQNWKAVEDEISWTLDFDAPGIYEVVVEQAHIGGGSKYQVKIGEQTIDAETQNTGKWTSFSPVRIGGVAVDRTGSYTVKIKPVEISGDALMALRGVTLKPVDSTVLFADRSWEFRFREIDLRYTKFELQEYKGEAIAVSHMEVGDGPSDTVYVPTDDDVLALASNDVLEMAGGDVVKATYADEFTQNPLSGSRLLTAELTATYFDATVNAIAYDLVRSSSGAVNTVPKRLMRVEPGERIIVQIQDYDRDQTAARDTIPFEVVVNDGEPVAFVATETDQYTGIFTKEVDTSATAEEGKLTVKSGDRIYCRYLDSQNTFPGHAVPRETAVLVNTPTEGLVTILESRLTPVSKAENAPLKPAYKTPDDETEIAGVALEAPLTIEVIDPDAAKDSRSRVIVKLQAGDGSVVDVECRISNAFKGKQTGPLSEEQALLNGRFIGQVILQLGGKESPSLAPLTADMPRNLIGGPVMTEDDAALDNLVTRVLNVTGQDVISATYNDAKRPDGAAADLNAKGRLIVNGELASTDRDYDNPIEQLHVGEKLFLRVIDADRDTSDERDVVRLKISGENGESEQVDLIETLAHSGVFTGSFPLKASEKPTPGNLTAADPFIETYFGDTIEVEYVDPAASSESGELSLSLTAPVVIGTNGLVSAFTKVFNNEDLAIETKFHIAESYFELFKSHRQLERAEESRADLEAGRRVLREVMEDYPDPKYAPRVAYLLGQFAQELEQWQEAIAAYDSIIRQFPDHALAADAQYKLAQCHEEAGDFDKALEGYVVLAATYPNSPLIASVMIRISDYFYKNENFEVAAQVGSKFSEKFPGHQHASRMAFRVGQCYYKAKEYAKGGDAFDNFVKTFPDDALAADALFWSGESYRQAKNNAFAFRRYNRCRWDFPASEAAKYARGRLALPEMINQFEAEAASLDK